MIQKVKAMTVEIEDQLIQFTQELIQIKSVTGEEKEVALHIKDKMESLGYDDVFIDKLGNVLGVIGNGEQKIMFDSHIDTVEVKDEAEWTFPPFSGHISDGKIYGRGTSDMKSAVAATIYAGYIIKSLNLHHDKTVYVSTSVMEEDYDGQGLLYLCKENDINPDYVVICEPSNMNLALGHRGRALIRIDIEGVSAHGSVPETGINAVYKMNNIIEKIEEYAQTLTDKVAPKGSLALTKIESEAVSLNAVPAKCSVYLDRRLVVGENKEVIGREMDMLLGGSDATWVVYDEIGKSWTGEDLVLHSFLPAWNIDVSHELANACKAAYKSLRDEDPKLITWDFCTNGVASAGLLGIPTIGIGPGDPKVPHTRDEHCPVEQIVQACEFYAGLVYTL